MVRSPSSEFELDPSATLVLVLLRCLKGTTSGPPIPTASRDSWVLRYCCEIATRWEQFVGRLNPEFTPAHHIISSIPRSPAAADRDHIVSYRPS